MTRGMHNMYMIGIFGNRYRWIRSGRDGVPNILMQDIMDILELVHSNIADLKNYKFIDIGNYTDIIYMFGQIW